MKTLTRYYMVAFVVSLSLLLILTLRLLNLHSISDNPLILQEALQSVIIPRFSIAAFSFLLTVMSFIVMLKAKLKFAVLFVSLAIILESISIFYYG